MGHPGPRAAGTRRGGQRAAGRAMVPRAGRRRPCLRGTHLSIDRRWRRQAPMIGDLSIAFGRVAFVMLFVLNLGGLLTWVERKQSAIMQDRIGANRASILGFRLLGLFHPLADAIKMLTKEDFRPARADRFLFGARRDRKSTRLNSSHQIISYAVFCLKKKNNTR